MFSARDQVRKGHAMRPRIFLIFLLALLFILPPTSSPAKSAKCRVIKKKTCYLASKYHNRVQKTKNKTIKKRIRKRLVRRYRSRITARSAVVLDADTNYIYFAKDPYLPRQPASTIKIVTGLLALENLNENDPVPVSRYAEQAPRQKAYLQCGEVYPAIDLIYATLIHSANDASRALAEKIAGSEKSFARIMTKTAQAFGAKNTVCRTATGLTAPGQFTTAYDLAVIFKKTMQNERFANIVKTRRFEIQGGKLIFNHNKALWQIAGAEGGKTGFTRAASKTYVGMFKRGNRTVIVACLGSKSLWRDVRYLVRKAFSEVKPTIHAAKSKRPASYY